MMKNWLLLGCLLCVASVWGQNRWLPRHPRLLWTGEETAAVKNHLKTDQLVGEMGRFLQAKADSVACLQQLPYEMDKYGNMLWTSRAYVFRLHTLALAYRLYGDVRYLKAAEAALQWVCSYPDWDPKHYLDTAEMTAAVAVAYDWLYEELPTSLKKEIQACIYRNALTRVLKEYRQGGPGSWAKRETNWNVVCNTGMVLGALAVAEDYPQETAIILDNAAQYMPNCLQHFAPDGVCFEGPAYWGYTSTYLSLYLKAVADNDQGRGDIARLPGIARTALYSKRTLTPSGRVFNFANASSDPQNTPAYFFFSRYYRQPEVAEWYRNEIQRVIQADDTLNQWFFLSLAWWDASAAPDEETLPPLEVYHNGINDIVVLNGDRRQPGALFLIAKGGQPNQAHQQMDGGTFLVESDGICWTDDMGADDYALPGFWDYRPGGQRWSYFRNNNFSHNTLSIDHQLQYADGKAFVCEEQPTAVRPTVCLDMSGLYHEQATAVHRRFTLLEATAIEVEDKVLLNDSTSVVTWSCITRATVETNGNTAHLRKSGKDFYLRLISPAGAAFQTVPVHPTYPGEKPMEGFTLLKVDVRFPSRESKIVVRMSSQPED